MKMSSLEFLDVTICCGYSNENLMAILQSPKNTGVKELKIKFVINRLEDKVLELIPSIVNCLFGLTHLDLT